MGKPCAQAGTFSPLMCCCLGAAGQGCGQRLRWCQVDDLMVVRRLRNQHASDSQPVMEEPWSSHQTHRDHLSPSGHEEKLRCFNLEKKKVSVCWQGCVFVSNFIFIPSYFGWLMTRLMADEFRLCRFVQPGKSSFDRQPLFLLELIGCQSACTEAGREFQRLKVDWGIHMFLYYLVTVREAIMLTDLSPEDKCRPLCHSLLESSLKVTWVKVS